jgi:hypothetical protein
VVPVILKWRRPLGGVKTIEAAPADFLNGTTTTQYVGPFSFESDDGEDFELRISDLEDPLVVRFINAWGKGEVPAFLTRFGPLRREPMYDLEIDLRAEELAIRLVSSTNQETRWRNANSVNLMLHNVDLKVGFEWDLEVLAGRLVLRPDTLLDFMRFEIAAAHEAGAVTTECAHCGKVYLTGPLTGRRSHSKFCADRCRVAAMRLRNKQGKDATNVD